MTYKTSYYVLEAKRNHFHILIHHRKHAFSGQSLARPTHTLFEFGNDVSSDSKRLERDFTTRQILVIRASRLLLQVLYCWHVRKKKAQKMKEIINNQCLIRHYFRYRCRNVLNHDRASFDMKHFSVKN